MNNVSYEYSWDELYFLPIVLGLLTPLKFPNSAQMYE